jgi:predicted nucleic acid-binding protein
MGRGYFGRGTIAENPAMVLVDTSIIIAWMDRRHEHHRACAAALEKWAAGQELAVSSVTFAELASGG